MMGAFDDLIPNNNMPQGSPVRSIPLGRNPMQPGQIAGQGLTNKKAELDINRAAALHPEELRQIRLNNELKQFQVDAAIQARSGTLTPAQQLDIRREAVDRINIARKMQARAHGWTDKGSFLPSTGLGAISSRFVDMFGGTDKAYLDANAGTLKAGASLGNILAMAKANGGKNPLTPMSNSDVELLSNITGNLTNNLNPNDYSTMLERYVQANVRAFQGAGGDVNKLWPKKGNDVPIPKLPPRSVRTKAPQGGNSDPLGIRK